MRSLRFFLLRTFLLGLLVTGSSVKAFSFKHDPDLREKLAKFDEACQIVGEKMAEQKIASESRFLRSPKLIFADQASAQAFQDYKDRFNELYYKLLYNAAGDGFILGLLAGLVQHVQGIDEADFKLQLSLLAGVGLMINLQDYQIGGLSYYNHKTLKPCKEAFKWWRAWIASIAASVVQISIDSIRSGRCL